MLDKRVIAFVVIVVSSCHGWTCPGPSVYNYSDSTSAPPTIYIPSGLDPGTSCTWVVISSPLYELAVSTSSECPYVLGAGRITFYEGAGNASRYLGYLQGDNAGFRVQANVVTIVIEANQLSTAIGYSVFFDWRSFVSGDACSGVQVVNLTAPATITNSRLYDTQYPPVYGNGSCYWRLEAPPGHVIWGPVAAVRLQLADALLVYDGPNDTAPLQRVVSSISSNMCLQSSGQLLFLAFQVRSAQRLGLAGFSLGFQAYPVPTSYCRGLQNITFVGSGLLHVADVFYTNFNGPYLPYPAGLSCQFLLTAPPGNSVRLGASQSDLDYLDAVTVYDGNSTASPIVAQCTGMCAVLLTPFISTRGQVLVTFSSDPASRGGRGFEIGYTQTTPILPDCSGETSIDLLVSPSGNLVSNTGASMGTVMPSRPCVFNITTHGTMVKLVVSVCSLPSGASLVVQDGRGTYMSLDLYSPPLYFNTSVAVTYLPSSYDFSPARGFVVAYSAYNDDTSCGDTTINGLASQYGSFYGPPSLTIPRNCSWQFLGSNDLAMALRVWLRVGDMLEIYNGTSTGGRLIFRQLGTGLDSNTNAQLLSANATVKLTMSPVLTPVPARVICASWYPSFPQPVCPPSAVINAGDAISCQPLILSTTVFRGGNGTAPAGQVLTFTVSPFPFSAVSGLAHSFVLRDGPNATSPVVFNYTAYSVFNYGSLRLPLSSGYYYFTLTTGAAPGISVATYQADYYNDDRQYCRTYGSQPSVGAFQGNQQSFRYYPGLRCNLTYAGGPSNWMRIQIAVNLGTGASLIVQDPDAGTVIANWTGPFNTIASLVVPNYRVSYNFSAPNRPLPDYGFGFYVINTQCTAVTPFVQCQGTTVLTASVANIPSTVSDTVGAVHPPAGYHAYPPNLQCTFLLVGPPGSRIDIFFYNQHTRANVDYLAAFNGNGTGGAPLFNTTGCMGSSGYIPPSTSNVVTLVFTTGPGPVDINQYNGFELSWAARPEPTFCRGVRTLYNPGVVALADTPFGLFPYPPGLDCTFIIRPAFGVTVEGSINIDTIFGVDFVDVFYNNGQVARSSGLNTVPISFPGEVRIRFRSLNGTKYDAAGFYFSTSFVRRESSTITLQTLGIVWNGFCGGRSQFVIDTPQAYGNVSTCEYFNQDVFLSYQGNFTFSALRAAHNLQLGTPGSTLSAPRLQAVDSLVLDLSINYPQLTYVYNTLQTGSMGGVVYLPNLRGTGASFSASSAPVTQIILPLIQCVGAQLTLTYMSNLKLLSAPLLERTNAISLTSVNVLETINMSSLTTIDLDFRLDISAVSDLNLPSLRSARAMVLTTNNFLKRASAPALRTATISISGNVFLKTMDLSSYQGTKLSVAGTRLTSLSLPAFYAGDLSLTENTALAGLDLPAAYNITSLTLVHSLVARIDGPRLRLLGNVDLERNSLLSLLNFCGVRTVQQVTLISNPLLSCYDTVALFNDTCPMPDAPAFSLLNGTAGCSPTVRGVFGCVKNVTRVVDTAGCGLSVACIQAQIDASYSDQESSVSVPAGTYTGCAQPLSLRGKILTVFGAGMGVTVIDCGGVGRAFEFSSGEDASCELRDMTLRNGSESDGGLISMAGASPVIRNCELAFGEASREGGAVALFSDAAPLFVGCYIHDNVAQRGGGISVSSSSVALLGTRVEGNTAAAEGGGLAAVSTFAVSATASAFSFNRAQRGGGVYSDSALDLHGCVLRGNAASQFGGGLAAIPSEATGTWFNLTDCLVVANAAPGGAGVFGFSAQLAADNTTLRDNVAGADGGGGLSVTCNQNYRIFYNIIGPCPVAVSLRACTLANNTAAGVGGGALLRDVVVEVSGGAVVGNRAGTDGGGVYASVTALAASNVAWQDNAAGESGGALFCEPFTGTCDVRGATLSGNSAGVSGGAVHLCTAACPNATQGAVNPVLLPLPPLRESNTLGGNTVAAGGYGPDVATDPTRLSWLVAPPSTIVSGREFSGGTLTALVADSYGQTATSSASVLTLTLSVLHADGSSAGSDVVLGGTQTELANDGVAVFDVVTMTAVNTSFIDTNFILSCQLSELDSVYLNTPVFLSACSPGQGRPSATSRITCDDCAAGSYSSGDTVYVCTPCAAGSFSATAVSGACTPCPVKTHAPVAGAALCLACPDGYDASTPGAVECTQLAAYTGLTTAALAGTIGGVLVGLLIIACIIGVFVYRAARRRTMQKYYLDNDATVRTGTQETPLQKEVKKIIGSSSTTRIGGGLYSNVYKAKYENRWIALKVIKGEMATNSTAQQEFRREAVALSRLEDRRHPGIVKLQFFLSFNPMCIGVAFCTGGSLKRALQNKAFSSVREKVQLAGEAASALCSIHASNIVHLDIKTDNMLLSGDNHLVVADFGIARTLGLGGELDVAGEYVGTMDTKGDRESRSASLASQQHPSFAVNTMGSVAPGAIGPQFTLLSSTKSTDAYDTAYTPQYVDPIRILFDKNNDEAYLKMADVFSYGMVMWAIFSQEEPYAGEKPEDLVEKLRANPLLRPANLVDCPVFYDNLMRRCWHENPAMRPAFPEIHRVLTENMRDLYGFALDEGYANPSMDEHEVVAPAPPVAVPMQFADSFGSFNSGAFPGASMAMPSAYPVQPALQSVNSHINTMPLDSMTALSINSSDPNMSRVIPPLPLTAPPPIPSQPPPSPGSQPPPSPSSTTQTRAGSNPPSSPMSSLTSLGPPPPTHAAVAVVEREQPALPAKPPRRPTTTKPTVPPK